MADNNLFKYQFLEVSIGGRVTETRASRFRLSTQAGFHSVIAGLLYPADADEGKAGDEVTVSLTQADKAELYFTGTIYSANVHDKYRELLLTDSFRKLCDTNVAAAYRKEKASAIIDDVLAAAGVGLKSVTCPDVELARFSTQEIPARMALDLLIDALKEHGSERLTWFFDEKDVFHFGTPDDTGKNERETIAFETDKNILRKGPGWIETLPLPIRHSRSVKVDGKELVTVRSDLTVSRSRSRLTLWVREAQ